VDSKEPHLDFEDFLDGENRYAALKLTFPEYAQQLFSAAKEDAQNQYRHYKMQEEIRK